ncbi:MAG TPA: NADH:ubiquinone reductase (Na(+)-transporting) subunit B [Saprospiraceae bacterium]|nr:NADH:ubiquinone reductase (Na(+)-transporting) subunit B [Saprospiraceae bacterium]HPQ98357.1 NADH:ubiquinone reductase (Na(+)-transporting) subunit B [Saprospiraceae bacterium]HRV87264.1 NADH:ubiquinone reductase (Na(+)-transporting) subunit B [Saprospiraceae bacterium]
MGLLEFAKKLEPDKKKSPFLHTVYDGFFTFLFTPNTVTRGGVHVRDAMDLKRTMTFVVLALMLPFVFGTYNIGQQHFMAIGQHTGYFEALHLKLVFGLIKIVPIWVVSMVVGLGIEFYFANRKGHGIEEGFLVTGALIPLIMPPDIPLWILTVSIVFAVILGKEAFGGTGMNIWNIALLSRVFVFFAYPTTISGDTVWVAGFDQLAPGAAVDYGWAEHLFNGLFNAFGWSTFNDSAHITDAFTGATPLGIAAHAGWHEVTEVYAPSQMWWGVIPGSIGETSKPLILIGALMLIVTGIASWRIMAGMILGAALVALGLNAWGATPFMEVPWYYQFYMGSFFFAMAFMATDPVTGSNTPRGKWIYGFLIGCIGMVIRVLNPAYPEGWMLAILLLNTFVPLIDYLVVQSNITKRLKRA